MHRENDIAPQISPIWERNGLKGLKILHDTIYWWLNAIRLFFVIRGFKAMHIVIQNKSSWFGSDKLLLKPNKLLRTTGQILIVIFNSDQRWVQYIDLLYLITNMRLLLLYQNKLSFLSYKDMIICLYYKPTITGSNSWTDPFDCRAFLKRFSELSAQQDLPVKLTNLDLTNQTFFDFYHPSN